MIVPTVSNAIGCFSGDFERGPVESYLMISNEDELVSYYGKPNKHNFNDWMQASSFLQYGDQLFISRASNTDGSTDILSGITVSADTTSNVIPITGPITNIEVGSFVAFGDADGPVIERYKVLVVDNILSEITLDRVATIVVADDDNVYSLEITDNAVFDAMQDIANAPAVLPGLTVTMDTTSEIIPITGVVTTIEVGDYVSFGDVSGPVLTRFKVLAVNDILSEITLDAVATIVVADNDAIYDIDPVAVPEDDYIRTQMPILNYSDFENKELSIAMNSLESKLKIISRDPGNWGNDIEVAIALPSDFSSNKYIFDGIPLDDMFEYFPTVSEVGVVVRYDGVIKEKFTVSFDPTDVNESNKTIYIEDVINRTSNYIFVKDNTANTNPISSYIFDSSKGVLTLVNGLDSPIGLNDLARGYEVWDNKEEVDKQKISLAA